MTLYLIDADSAIDAMTARYEALRVRLTACAPGDVAISGTRSEPVRGVTTPVEVATIAWH